MIIVLIQWSEWTSESKIKSPTNNKKDRRVLGVPGNCPTNLSAASFSQLPQVHCGFFLPRRTKSMIFQFLETTHHASITFTTNTWCLRLSPLNFLSRLDGADNLSTRLISYTELKGICNDPNFWVKTKAKNPLWEWEDCCFKCVITWIDY